MDYRDLDKIELTPNQRLHLMAGPRHDVRSLALEMATGLILLFLIAG